MHTYRKIVSADFTFPAHISPDARSLIKKLLNVKPHKRLGVVKGGAKVVKSHNWFRDVNWRKLVNKELQSPYVPVVKSRKDTRNFDQSDKAQTEALAYDGEEADWDSDFKMKAL
jgi:p70 ribosomal S6 kinase